MRALFALLVSSIVITFCAQARADARLTATKPQIQFAEKAVVDALKFSQGDVASLVDTRPLFTASGWADFMKRLTGFLDPEGAPTFSSTFTPSGPAIVTKQDNESLTVTVPGVLKHESRSPQGGRSTTSYRAEADIRVSPGPFKIELLIQRTCGGATTRTSCR